MGSTSRGGAPTPGDHGQRSGGGNKGGPSRSGAAGGSVRPGGAPTPGDHGQGPSKSNTAAARPGGAPTPGDHGQGPSGDVAAQQASYRNELMKQGRMAEYNTAGAISRGELPGYEPGATPYVGAPSLGQVLGTLLGAAAGIAFPGAGLVNSAPDIMDAVEGGNANGIPTGGMIGRGIDAVTGGVPGKQTGWSTDRFHGVPGGVSANGGAVNGGPLAGNTAGGIQRSDQNDNAAPISEALRTILSQAGVWPPVKPSAI